ncbi:MAG: Unknown protein [uncultured Sulfurovum sp.]|uniref:Uncharacterized protein n=1 Tax=uncultured Sulfurovum sp. TaxID=269237 RepID=A0A6S6TIB8_9BACT|nr:MAG: Unknown protein [uncultured Sulfurovum sp.]
MTNTQLIQHIRYELKEQGFVWKREKELFEMLIPNEEWNKYKTSWSNWKKTDKYRYLTKSPNILRAIEKTLKFDSSIWSESDNVQKEIINKAIKEFLDEDKPHIDISILIPDEPLLTKKQANILKIIEEVAKIDIEEIVTQNSELFVLNRTNQKFLLELIPLLYSRGCYSLLHEKAFPSLLVHHQDKIEIKIKRANTLANLSNPDYIGAMQILNTIDNDTYRTDIQTTIISNFRRNSFNNITLSQDDLKKVLRSIIEYYYGVYLNQKLYHYYPAINLAYMVKLFDIIFQNNKNVEDYDLEKIYKEVLPSISNDKKEEGDNHYYAIITELEFHLILNVSGIDRKIETLLDNEKPEIFLVERTLKQMKWFIDVVEKFSTNKIALLKGFQEVIKLLEDYIYCMEENLLV